ncbi:MAG TPA: hypothetical protein PLD20_12885 [Blastocatellia bacterium]|nr:hypothetical protein [Blastocatellia bacterium]HMV86861.1 hypothetical protein [Blastocatellia bacterium]HMZ18823.1 hypothetical protein [Blastocatellia bacterium]HNG29865.1 hypothetical protein [Blastocatellia bacterium]
MTTTQAEKIALAAQNDVSAMDLQTFREGLSEIDKELFDIAISVPKEELMSTDEILAEIARRRGGIVHIEPRI